jgi:hypothetical protein
MTVTQLRPTRSAEPVRLLDAREVGLILGKGKRSAERLMASGALHTVIEPGRVRGRRVRSDDLQRYIDSLDDR